MSWDKPPHSQKGQNAHPPTSHYPIIKENFKINKTTILFSQKPHFFAPYICFLIPEILFRQSLSNHLHHSAMSINCYWRLKWLWQFRLPYLLLPLLQVTNQFHQIILVYFQFQKYHIPNDFLIQKFLKLIQTYLYHVSYLLY